MNDGKTNVPTLDDLNGKVHDLNYVDPASNATVNTQPDVERGKELAEKIKENIATYQDEVNTPHQPSVQAS